VEGSKFGDSKLADRLRYQVRTCSPNGKTTMNDRPGVCRPERKRVGTTGGVVTPIDRGTCAGAVGRAEGTLRGRAARGSVQLGYLELHTDQALTRWTAGA